MLLISGINIFHKQWQYNDLDKDIVTSTTKTGYVNDNITLKWLQHFTNYIKNKKQGAWLFFIIDNYDSHMTISFYNLATKNKIVLFCFSKYFNHLIQLLDIGVFQLFKYYYTDIIDKTVRLENEKFSKLKFLAVFQSFCNQTFKLNTIYHVF